MKLIDILNKMHEVEGYEQKFKIGDCDEYYIKNGTIYDADDDEPVRWSIYNSWLDEDVTLVYETDCCNCPVCTNEKLDELINLLKEINEKLDDIEDEI